MKVYILLLISLTLLNCTSSHISKKHLLEESIERIATKEFGEKYELKTNDKNTYTIVLKNYKMLTDLLPSVHFFIIEHKTSRVIFKDQLNAGTVYWYSNYEVAAIARNNNNDGSRLIYHFDVRTKKKIFID